MKLPILLIGLLAAGTMLASADPVTYDYTGLKFTECTFGTCPANYTSDYLIASFTLSAPPVPNLPNAQNELPFVTAWSISDKLGYFALSSSDPDAASELDLLSGGISGGIFEAEFDANAIGPNSVPGSGGTTFFRLEI
jgi:hypothetical protein